MFRPSFETSKIGSTMGLFSKRLQTSGLCRLDNCNNSERSSKTFFKTNEAPYQLLGPRTLTETLGYKELRCGHFWLSLLSECLSCYLYVFIVCSTRISWTGSVIGHEPNLIAMALSSGIAMTLLILTFRTVHVNPALTVSFLLTGRIPFFRALLYIIAHCVGAVGASVFLYSISVRGHAGALGLDKPHGNLTSWQILIVEIVISFVVTLTTYATCNYSSYTCAKKFVLEQLEQNSSSLLTTSPTYCDPKVSVGPSASRSSKRSVAPIVSLAPSTSITLLDAERGFATQPPNFRLDRQADIANGLIPDSYQDDNYNDYDYDNHRIYATQQHKPEPYQASQVPIEEVMRDECQLLAPNGFSLHTTTGQAFVIGLAYILTSLSGIPASGASLNPARSFGPAFIMNRWDLHWIYWLGPISGSVIAGFFYEFIFSPTRRSSLCYRSKLFRLSAQDMAKVGSKSRLYQHQHPKNPPVLQQQHEPQQAPQPQIQHRATTVFRHPNHQPIYHSPTSNNPHSSGFAQPTNSNLLQVNTPRNPAQLIPNSTLGPHLQSGFGPLRSGTFDQANTLQHESSLQQQPLHLHQQQPPFVHPKQLFHSTQLPI